MSELQGLQSRIRDIEASGAHLLAISVDGVEDARRVATRLGLTFPILSDTSREAVIAYGVAHPGGGVGGADIARPATFIVGPDKVIRWRSLTENYRVRVRPEHVLEALAAHR